MKTSRFADEDVKWDRPLADVSSRDLLTQAIRRLKELAAKEVELARAELRENMRAEIAMIRGVAIAALLAILGLNLALVGIVFALSSKLPGWAAALILAGMLFVAAIAAFSIGWSKRVRRPLERTRRSLEESWQWAKERMA